MERQTRRNMWNQQQIHEWRGAVRAMEYIRPKECVLRDSFRFGPHFCADFAVRALARTPLCPSVPKTSVPVDCPEGDRVFEALSEASENAGSAP